ncbi:class I SAM-dependent methyltransferase [Mycobacterium spongiae]|uniref:Methyltransferase domain-containing protein n=1 Tax=Mycobacterium spongiae TaxID=886343 RepID=A0A975JYN9_9MYCO|nr:class I SAM-dependent methyltransferase [Mycobacterium spongiae]QUR67504.1 methyltransferase domain-containing protein [Mycobacterium spongiae]
MTGKQASVDNPVFARVWTFLTRHEPAAVRALRQQNLAGLTGRVLEVGAGTGTNFMLYPESVGEVVALEPESRLADVARETAAGAPVPVTVTECTIEALPPDDEFDAVVCSLVLCSVDDPDTVLRQLLARLRPGGQLRYLEHVASPGLRGRLQRLADATVWPRIAGNCHTHRDTERRIAAAGFTPQTARHELLFPSWVPVPVSEVALGEAIRPAA